MKKVVIGYKQYDNQRWYIFGTVFEGPKLQDFIENDSFVNENDAIDRLNIAIEEYKKSGYAVEAR